LFALAADKGKVGEKIAYARFIGQHRDTEKGLDLLDSLRREAPIESIVQHGIAIVRDQDSESEQADPAVASRVESWLEQGLREDPESLPLLMQKAEFLDVTRQYEASADQCRALLDHRGLDGVPRAIVLNDLAYLLSVAFNRPDAGSEALDYVKQTVDIIGPTSDVLDTRAVAYLAAGGVALLVGIALRDEPPLVLVAGADLAATLVIFAFSRAFGNSSFYDAYWSVAPVPIALYLALGPGAEEALPARQGLVLLLVGLWAVRLTHNWARGWTLLSRTGELE